MSRNGTVSSFSVQARVIWALLLREMLTRFGRANLGFAWLFIEPMLFTATITALWATVRIGHASSMDVIAFAVTGYSTVLLWRNPATRCTKAVEANLGLLYHRNIKVTDLFAARILLEVVGATASFMALVALLVFGGWIAPPANVLSMTVAWLMLGWFGAGLALAVGALTERSDLFDRIWHPVAYILFPLSGAMFMVDWLPPAAQQAVLWLPIIHGVEALRHGYFGDVITTHYDLGYLAVANMILLLIGLILSRSADLRVEPQ